MTFELRPNVVKKELHGSMGEVSGRGVGGAEKDELL